GRRGDGAQLFWRDPPHDHRCCPSEDGWNSARGKSARTEATNEAAVYLGLCRASRLAARAGELRGEFSRETVYKENSSRESTSDSRRFRPRHGRISLIWKRPSFRAAESAPL